MLMKTRTEPVDFHAVLPIHEAIHLKLENWARYVEVRRPRWINPMWKWAKSHGRQWHAPELRPEVNTLEGHAMEKAVANLPVKHREAIRWSYVHRDSPARKARELAVTYEGLKALVSAGRSMLINHGTHCNTKGMQSD